MARGGPRVVYGVPVEWTVTEGVLPLWRDDERAWGADYVALADEEGRRCHPAPERERSYRAGLRAEVVIEWDEQGAEAQSLGDEVIAGLLGDGFERSPLCEGPGFEAAGCGCRSGGGGSGWAFVVSLLGLRRRRR
ncbi:MAG: MYXO-CTERM sorting domain-containing protein [Nannocystaceae bacterium]